MRRVLLALIIIGALIGISPRAHGQSGIGGGTAPGSGSNGLSGLTTGQVPIAATATTATSSKPLAGSGAAITTGPSSSTTGDCVQFTGAAGQISDSGSACGSGAGTVTHTAGALTAKQLVIGNGSADIAVDPDAETDGAGNLTATSVTTPGDGTHPGAVYFVGNTTNPTIPTNDFGITGFTVTNATAYGWQPNSTAPSGTQFMTAGTPSSGWSPVNYVSSTGSGSVVLATSPTLVSPALGTPSSGIITSLTGTCTACTANAVPAANVTGTTLASSVVTSSLTSAAGGSFGTAAFVATGTSGATIPLLNGTNTWSATQAGAAWTGTTGFEVTTAAEILTSGFYQASNFYQHWASSTSDAGTVDSIIGRVSAGLLGISGNTTNPTTQATATGGIVAQEFEAGGTKFTTSGCSVSSTTGGGSAGKMTLGANTCTVVITTNSTAANGWSCHANDETTVAANATLYFSANNATTASMSVPSTAGSTDVIDFACIAY